MREFSVKQHLSMNERAPLRAQTGYHLAMHDAEIAAFGKSL